jgi:hypothetical protein
MSGMPEPSPADAQRDWYAWHDDYDRPGSGLAQRLEWVREHVRVALDTAPPGPLRAISLCAGQGRDLIGALAGHPRRADVTARLVELDPRNTEVARRLAAEAGLPGVQIVTGDAALTSQYADLVPADLVLACGLFGNMTNADIEATIGYCTQMCATGGTVIWTRGRWARGAPDLVPQVCAWFEERGFDRLWVSDPQIRYCVGAHAFTGVPAPLAKDAVMFAFTGYDRRSGPPRE